MNKLGILLIASAFVVSACGKRTDDSAVAQSPGYNAQGQPTDPTLGAANTGDYSVLVTSSAPSLPAGGTETTVIKAVVTDSSNLPVADLPVDFSSTGGRFKAVNAITDENGLATAELSLEFHAANQDIQIKVVAGNFSGSARVVAEGSTLALTGDKTAVPGNDVTITAALTAGDGKTPLANENITISSLVGNVLSTTTGLTDPLGKVEVVVGTANGADTVTFSALNNSAGVATVVESHSFVVSDDQLNFAEDTAIEVPVNTGTEFSVNWSFNGTPTADENLVFSLTAGEFASESVVRTDEFGNATVEVWSATAGRVTLYVESEDKSVINKHEFDFVGDTPNTIELATSSSRVNSRDNATIVAHVADANGNPVKNTEVNFSSTSLKGGQLSSTTAQTDVDGNAEITFTAGGTATEQNEVNIVVEVTGTNINDEVLLTVVEPALNITLGSSNLAERIGEETQYAVTYVVQVADGGGQALKDATVQLSIEPLNYRKGRLERVDEAGISMSDSLEPTTWKALQWVNYIRNAFALGESVTIPADPAGPPFSEEVTSAWSFINGMGTAIECPSEDLNKNRILDAGEDRNNNGSLDPQDPAVLVAVDNTDLATIGGNGILTTDASGSGYFRVVYPVSNSSWSDVKIVARAQALGVEATDSYFMSLSPVAEEVAASNLSPVHYRSPYGSEVYIHETSADGSTITYSSGCYTEN